MVVDCYHVACVCGDWVKILIFKKDIFLKIAIFLKIGKKVTYIPFGNGAEFRPLRTQKNPWIKCGNLDMKGTF